MSEVFSSAPCEFSSVVYSPSYSSRTPAISACRVSICVLPPIFASKKAFFCSVQFSRAPSSSFSVFVTPMNFPSASHAETPSASIAAFADLFAPMRLTSMLLSDVPASLALMPLFASTPSSVADSSSGTFRFRRVPPHPTYASSRAVSVELLFDCAAVHTSR